MGVEQKAIQTISIGNPEKNLSPRTCLCHGLVDVRGGMMKDSATTKVRVPLPAMRLQRYLALCGVASRRAAEKLIAEGHVAVNGTVVTRQGLIINPARDLVAVRGQSVTPERKLYLAVHKPRGCICSARDPQGRPTLFDWLRRDPSFPRERLFTVGRLDFHSEGLLLLTTDGEWAQRIAHPRYQVEKTYHVWLRRPLSQAALEQLRQGIVTPEGARLELKRIRPWQQKTSGIVYEVSLCEGRNRHVRRMFEFVGAPVKRLLRVRIGPLTLGNLRAGQWRFLQTDEARRLASPINA